MFVFAQRSPAVSPERAAVTSAERYRKLAAQFRIRAAREKTQRAVAEWNTLAKCYLRLAKQADQNSLTDIAIEIAPSRRKD